MALALRKVTADVSGPALLTRIDRVITGGPETENCEPWVLLGWRPRRRP